MVSKYLANCSLKEQERMVWEACVKSITFTKEKKSNMPSHLHHLDKGLKESMMFPKSLLLFLMQICDLYFSESSKFLEVWKMSPKCVQASDVITFGTEGDFY